MKNTDALKALQGDPKPFLIDLREPKEITQTIESAVNIPVRSLLKNLNKLPAKDAPILLYCGVGHRGGVASTLLQMLGYKNAKSINGGFNGWRAVSLPIVDGSPAEPTASGVTVDVDKDLFAALDAWLACHGSKITCPLRNERMLLMPQNPSAIESGVLVTFIDQQFSFWRKLLLLDDNPAMGTADSHPP